MTPVEAVPFVALAALLGTCAWVYRDAQAQVDAGTPVVLQIGSFRVDTPQAWAAGCLVLFILLFPLYLAARDTSFTGRH
jgi:hypothetical protein